MKLRIDREYCISYGQDYDLVEIAESYYKGHRVLSREEKTYHSKKDKTAAKRLIKVLESLPPKYVFIFKTEHGYYATVTATRQQLRCLSVSPQLNNSSTTDENNSTIGE